MDTKKGYLYHYYKREERALLKSIRSINNDFNHKQIHKLRISIKKIRGMYELLKKFFPDKFTTQKPYPVIKKIFKRAGQIRELQVNKILILDHTPLSDIIKSYLLEQDKKQKKHSSSFRKDIGHVNVRALTKEIKKAKKLCRNISDTEVFTKVNEFIHDETQKIWQLYKGAEKTYNIHKIRKHLKILLYILKLCNTIKPSTVLRKLEITLKETEELLGKWHDRTILLRSLKKFIKNSKPGYKQATSLKKIVKKFTNQKEAFLSDAKFKIALIFKTMPKQISNS